MKISKFIGPLIAALLVLPGYPSLERTFGWPATLLILLGLASVWLWLFRVFKRGAGPSAGQARLAVLILTAFLAIIFFALHPLFERGREGGSDRNEDIQTVTGRLLKGEYPYYARTYLGNPVTTFPGLAILHAPFRMLGNAAYGNFTWVLLLFFTLCGALKNTRGAFLAWIGFVFFCPETLREFFAGGSYLSNSILVFSAVIFFERSPRWISAALLGLALSSRPNFLLILPVLFAGQAAKPHGLVKLMASAGVYLAVTLPFFIYDPYGFSPLENTNRFSALDPLFPGISFWLPAGCVLVSSFIGLKVSSSRGLSGLLLGSALALLFPVLLLAFLPIFYNGVIDLTVFDFALPASIFGIAWLARKNFETAA